MKISASLLCLLLLLTTVPALAQVKPSPAKTKASKIAPPKKQKLASEDASEQSTERSANEDAKVEANDHVDSPDAAVTTATTRPVAREGNGDPYLRLATIGSFISEAIRFEPDGATLQDGSLDDLNGIGEVLLERDSLTVEIGVYSEVNESLSQTRAEALKAHLVRLGVAAERLRAKGYGKATRQRVEFMKK
ncbi:MAG: hypothetical protein H7Y12_15385 [Sphingobacteriaceae bacterium]|nr:hypothetical protein [Cytophagaceae bacterium]